MLGWGSTHGAIFSAVQRAQAKGLSVAGAQLRYLHPHQKNLRDVLRSYRRVLIPELNHGQLLHKIRADFLIDAVGYSKMQGKPFMISELEQKIDEVLKGP